MSRFRPALPPRAARGEVSAEAPVKARKRTEGSWGGASIEASIHFRSVKRLMDRFEYDLGSTQHIVVPEAQHPKTTRSEKHVSTGIVVRLLGMLASVQLDDDGSLKAREVADIGSDRMLSAEFEACQLTSAQTLPKHALRMSRVFAKGAGEAKHPPTRPRIAGISMANYNPCEHESMTPPALRATSPAKLGRQVVVAP
jgi:hypothetical protein